MKRTLILFAGVMVFVLLFAGFSTSDAKAVSVTTPQEACNFIIDIFSQYGWILPGSHYDAFKEQCVFGWSTGEEGGSNRCYPLKDIYQIGWETGPVATDIDGPRLMFNFVGCAHNGHYIQNPFFGNADLGDGVTFTYQHQTCANGCNVTKFGLTGAAKRALNSLSGKVIAKTYVQIRDDKGALISGDFSLCFYAKGAKNPSFFRFGGGNTWARKSGYWRGDNFCMRGTYSGNYVLVDLP